MLRREQKGWVGIDIGTANVKIAQLVRRDGELRVLATALVPRGARVAEVDSDSVASDLSSAGEIRTAIAVGGAFHGRHAAAVMPMSYCDVHQVGSLAMQEDTDVDQEIRSAIETITQYSADHLEFDIWPADLANQQRWNVLAVARPWSDRIYFDVVESGYSCNVIDGVPQALARAIGLTAADDAMPPTAVLDWGFSQATFCLVADGLPVYVRVLKDCSFQAALAVVAEKLGVTSDEAAVLLEKYGARGLNFKTEDEIVSMIAELVAEPLRHLEAELAKTLSHVAVQYRNYAPRKLVLFGGGALVGGLPRYFSRKTRMDTQVWSFDKHEPHTTKHDAIFGVAMALSALAWEGQ